MGGVSRRMGNQELNHTAQVCLSRPIKILELFGGIGSPRCALRNQEVI